MKVGKIAAALGAAVTLATTGWATPAVAAPAEGWDIAVSAVSVGSGATPPLTYTVTNKGTVDVVGVRVHVVLELAIELPFLELPADCRFVNSVEDIICDLPTLTIAAGATVQTPVPLKFKSFASALGPRTYDGKLSVLGIADWRNDPLLPRDDEEGDAAPPVDPAPNPMPTEPGQELDFSDNVGTFSISTPATSTDVAISTPQPAHGRVGETVKISVTMTNKGPSKAWFWLNFTTPPGTVLVSPNNADTWCGFAQDMPIEIEVPVAGLCRVHSRPFEPGESFTFDMPFRIDALITPDSPAYQGPGKISVENRVSFAGNEGDDTHPADNSAALVIDVTDTGATAPATTAPALPATGSRSGGIVVTGLVVLAMGVGLVALAGAWRRRGRA